MTRRLFATVHVLLALIAAPLVAQAPPSRDAIVAAARSVITQARYASFATIDAAGQPQVRVVDPFAPDADFTIWIATNAQSRKVTQATQNAKVTLLYFDSAAKNEVTLLGRASVVTDRAEKARHWKEDWAAFYSNKNLGDDYVLIRVIAEQIEISAPSLGMNNDPRTWTPVTLKLR